MENALWNALGWVFNIILLGLAIGVGGNLLTPRVVSLYQRWGNNRRTASLAQLDKEDTEVRKLHDNTDELIRYGLMHLTVVLGVFLLAICLNWLLLIHATQEEESARLFGLSLLAIDRMIALFGTLFVGIVLTQRMLSVSLTVSNVYFFDRWTEYVGKRRVELTKARSASQHTL